MGAGVPVGRGYRAVYDYGVLTKKILLDFILIVR